jgi:hypothetical protein
MRRRWILPGACARVIVLLVVLGLALSPASVARAQDPEPPPDDGDGGDNPIEVISRIFHTMIFPIESMTAALNQSIANIMKGAVADAAEPFVKALDGVVYGAVAGGPEEAMYGPAWALLRNVSIALWPLTLGLIAASAARGGVENPMGFADLKHGLVEWASAAVLALASAYLLGLGVRLSGGVTTAILTGVWAPVDPAALVGVFFNAVLVTTIGDLVPGAMIFFILFMLILGFSLCTALLFAYVARYAMLIVLISTAPLVLTLSVVPALRWLLWLWLKGIVLMLLLGPANALLLKLASLAATGQMSALGGGDLFGGLVNLLATAAVLSLLLTIDYAVIKGVFGAIGEIAEKAKAATEQVVAGVIMLAGAALTGGLLGAAGVAGAAGASAAAGGGGAAAAAGGGAGGSAAAAGAAGGAAAGEGTGSGAAGTAAATSGSSGASATQAALNDPGFLRRMGAMLKTAGSAGTFSRSPIARALSGVARGVGDAAGERAHGIEQGEHQQELDQAREAAQERGLHRGWQGTLDANGISPNTPGFADMSRSLSRLEDAYGGQAVRQAAPEVVNGMAAAQRYGGIPLDAQARSAGYATPADYLGGQVEGRIRAQGDASQAAPIFAPTGSPSPGAWGPGPGPFDYRVGTDLAGTLGRRGPEAVDAYARLAHAVRNPALGAGQDAVSQLYTAAGTAWGLGGGSDFESAVWPYFATMATGIAHDRGLADEQLPSAWLQEQMFLARGGRREET